MRDLQLLSTLTATASPASITVLCRCCGGHTDALTTPARVCVECRGYCQCSGCQADGEDSRAAVRGDE